MSVVKGVSNWRTLAKILILAYESNDDGFKLGTDLDALQRKQGSDEECLKTVVRRFLQGTGGRCWQASWRVVIWSLYKANELQLANQIRSYSEQLEGVCLCMYAYIIQLKRLCTYRTGGTSLVAHLLAGTILIAQSIYSSFIFCRISAKVHTSIYMYTPRQKSWRKQQAKCVNACTIDRSRV